MTQILFKIDQSFHSLRIQLLEVFKTLKLVYINFFEKIRGIDLFFEEKTFINIIFNWDLSETVAVAF